MWAGLYRKRTANKRELCSYNARGLLGPPCLAAAGSRYRVATLHTAYPGPSTAPRGRGPKGKGALLRGLASGGLGGPGRGLRARWCGRCVAVSRFFCFPIQMNFAENKKWPRKPAWRGPG